MGTFFPSCRQLYLSSFSDTHKHTHTHTYTHIHTHEHTHTRARACACNIHKHTSFPFFVRNVQWLAEKLMHAHLLGFEYRCKNECPLYTRSMAVIGAEPKLLQTTRATESKNDPLGEFFTIWFFFFYGVQVTLNFNAM